MKGISTMESTLGMKPIWLAIQLDTMQQATRFIGLSEGRYMEAQRNAKLKSGGLPFVVVNLRDPGIKTQQHLIVFLRANGLPDDKVVAAVVSIGQQLNKLVQPRQPVCVESQNGTISDLTESTSSPVKPAELATESCATSPDLAVT